MQSGEAPPRRPGQGCRAACGRANNCGGWAAVAWLRRRVGGVGRGRVAARSGHHQRAEEHPGRHLEHDQHGLANPIGTVTAPVRAGSARSPGEGSPGSRPSSTITTSCWSHSAVVRGERCYDEGAYVKAVARSGGQQLPPHGYRHGQVHGAAFDPRRVADQLRQRPLVGHRPTPRPGGPPRARPGDTFHPSAAPRDRPAAPRGYTPAPADPASAGA